MTRPTMRETFEKIISADPYGKSVERYPNDDKSAWPGNYRDINVDLAWCVLRDCIVANRAAFMQVGRVPGILGDDQ